MNKKCFYLLIALIGATNALSNDLEKAVADDICEPVRPIGVNNQQGWNTYSHLFMYPPTFAFTNLANATKYRFEAKDEHGVVHGFVSNKPTDSLAPVWAEIPVGWVTLSVTGIASGESTVGFAGSRRFWKKAPFRPNAYPPALRSYDEAARLAYLYICNSKSTDILLRTGDIDRAYPHNCFPTKMLSRTIHSMVDLAKYDAANRNRAMKIAENAADWLIAHSFKAPSPLAGFPPTYDYHAEAAEVEPKTCASISKERAGISMNIYPAEAALAYLDLYAANKNIKYLNAAKTIAERFIALQGQDGTWHLNQRIADGAAIGTSRMMPIQGIIPALEQLARFTGDKRYRDAAERAFGFIENGPLKTWNWEGQFEDTPQAPQFKNLTKHDACSTAIYLVERFPNNARRLAQARELLRFAEDQFVFWEKPYTPASEPANIREWNRPWFGKWECPSVTEQYSCYRPIDASAAKLINTYIALYRASGNPLDLAKARALGDKATRIQSSDGFIRTFWSDHPHVTNDNWVNCMLATAAALSNLSHFP